MGKVRELECRSIDIFHYLVMNFYRLYRGDGILCHGYIILIYNNEST